MRPAYILWVLSILLWISCKPVQYPLVATEQENNYLSPGAPIDSSTYFFIQPYRQKLDSAMSLEIGFFAKDMVKDHGTGSLDIWIANSIYDFAKTIHPEVAVAIHNSGGIRLPVVESGPVLRSTIFELSPFDNNLVFVTLSGEELEQLIQHTIDQGGWPISRQLSFEVEKGKLKNLRIRQLPVATPQTYIVALQDYIANGGDDTFFLKDKTQEQTGILIRDILLSAVPSAEGNNRE